MNTLSSIIISIAALVAVVIVAFFGFKYTTTYAQQVENEARFQCAQSSKYEVEDQDALVTYPVTNLYQECLVEKGIN